MKEVEKSKDKLQSLFSRTSGDSETSEPSNSAPKKLSLEDELKAFLNKK